LTIEYLEKRKTRTETGMERGMNKILSRGRQGNTHAKPTSEVVPNYKTNYDKTRQGISLVQVVYLGFDTDFNSIE
jgi:hypothetical protein